MTVEYPASLPPETIPEPGQPGNQPHSYVYALLRAALVELGTDPSGTDFATVKAALAAMARLPANILSTTPGSAYVLDFAGRPPDVYLRLVLNAVSCAVSFANVPTRATVVLVVDQGTDVGSRTFTLPAGVKPPNGVPFVMPTGVGQRLVLNLLTFDGGTRWDYAPVGAYL